jgi:hypothetical protein
VDVLVGVCLVVDRRGGETKVVEVVHGRRGCPWKMPARIALQTMLTADDILGHQGGVVFCCSRW